MKYKTTRIAFIFLSFILMFSMTPSNAEEVKFPPWHIDSQLVVGISVESGILKVALKNSSDQARMIWGNVSERSFFLSNCLTVGFIDIDSPRGKRDEFRIFADGVIGVNSEFHAVAEKALNRNETIVLEIALMDAMRDVKNKKLQEYLSKNGSRFRLSISYDLRAFGLNSDCSLRYVLPEMSIQESKIVCHGSDL